jgi:hypothetical protein
MTRSRFSRPAFFSMVLAMEVAPPTFCEILMKNLLSSVPSRCLLVAFGATVAFAATSFGQAIITTAHGNGADTYLSNDANAGPTVIHGGAGAMNVRAITNSRARTMLLRFDVSDFVAESLTGATLTLNFTATNRARTWDVLGLTDGNLSNWLESETNYNNAPGMLAADLGNYAVDTSVWSSLGTFAVSTTLGQQTSNTVSLNLDSFLTGNTNGLVSLLLVFAPGTDTNPDWWVTSKEGNPLLAPTLNMPNAQIIPEPSTYAAIFGALALLGAVYFRRRKNS